MSEAATLAWHQYRLERKMFWRNPAAAFFNFFLPLLFLFLFGAIFNGDQKNLDILVPGIDGLAGALVTGAGIEDNLTALGVIALWTAGGIFFAIRGFTWEARRA